MDTNPYANVLNAIRQQTPMANSGLTVQQQIDNNNACSELTKQGVYIPDMIKRLDRMEAEMKELKEKPQKDMDRDLFRVMEASVKDDGRVKTKRQALADIKTVIITEQCMKDPRYVQAWDDYKTTVNAVYIERKEHGRISTQVKAEDGKGIGGKVRHNEGRGNTAETGISPSQEAEEE